MITHAPSKGKTTASLGNGGYVVLEASLHRFIRELGDNVYAQVQEERSKTGTIECTYKTVISNVRKQWVTKYDIMAQRAITKYLQDITPGIAVISQEQSHANRTKKRHAIASGDSYWTMDPIDGTKRMIDGQASWSILVSLIHDGIPVIGLAYFPELHKFFYTKNGKAFLETPDETRQLHVQNRIGKRPLRLHYRSLFDEGDGYYTQSATRMMRTDFPKDMPMQSELALAMGQVDMHRGGTFWALPKEWDIAPLIAIVRAAGGEIYNVANNNHDLTPFRFDNSDVPSAPLYWGHPKVMKELQLIAQDAPNTPIKAHQRTR